MKTHNEPSSLSFNFNLLFLIVFYLSGLFAIAQVNPNQSTRPKTTKKDVVQKASADLKKLIQQKSPDYVITAEHVSSTTGIRHIYLRQAIGDLEVVGTESSVHLDATGKVVAEHSNFLENINNTLLNTSSSIQAEQAIRSVAQQMNYGAVKNLGQITSEKGKNKAAVYSKAGISNSKIPVKLMYYYRERVGTTLIWELSVEEKNSSDWWNFRVDAQTGQIIDKVNFTVSCIEESHEHHSKLNNEGIVKEEKPIYTVENEPTSMVGSYNVIELPLESPNFGSRSVVTNPDNAVASPYGWHDTDGVAGAESEYTVGNNADAYDDSSSTQTGTGEGDNSERAFGGAGLVFNDPFNPVYSNGDRSIDAAVTNVFYWSNIIHDITYQYGFDEASGNFQINNYGNGGIGGDSVRAEAQDGSGTCNANFSTPVDGNKGRMQMYVCNSRDGDFDNAVITHEYGHGISTRLTGGAGDSNCLNRFTHPEQMGEGWSDFFGLVFTMNVGEQGDDARGVGTWLLGEGPNGQGIRTYRYSTDLAENPHTYDAVKSAVVPHGVGEIWAVMLWDMTWDLIDVYGFDPDIYNGNGGNNIAMNLVMEGLKLQPCGPGFVDGRDAILAADQALYGGANYCTIWKAFARRGLGFSASQGSSTSITDGTEAFDMPPNIALFNTAPETLCVTAGIQSGLGGGTPTGGIYSGTGVSDDGNGTTFTFDPSIAGIGTASITYTVSDACNPGSNTALIDTIEITDGLPDLICKNTSITLDGAGNASIENSDVIANTIPDTSTYTLDESGTFALETITGTPISLGDDNGTTALPIGFDFSFYGNTYSSFYIASNGFISFDGSGMTGSSSYTPTALPNANTPNNMIAVVWDDLSPNNGGAINYETIGTAPNRKLVIDFVGVPLYNDAATITAQVQIYEGSSLIEIHSTDVQNNGGSRTMGIENADGTAALAATGRNNQVWTANNDYVAFVPGITNNLADNCGNPVVLSLSKMDFTCKDIGDNIVTVTADDGNGGIATCEAIVTVEGPTTTYTGTWDNGVPDTSKKAIFNSNYNTSTADIDACSCEVGNNAEVTVGGGDYMKVEGNITVNSGASLVIVHEGSVVQVDDNATVTNNGTITVEKTSPSIGNRGFMIASSPMTEDTKAAFGNPIQFRNHITSNFVPNQDVEDDFPDANNFADDNGDNWQQYVGMMNPGEGYLMMPQTTPTIGTPASYDFEFDQGTLNNGVISFTLGYNGTQNGSPNILGNPYASAIDVDVFFDDNTMIDDVYFWEHLNPPSNYPGYNVSNYDMGDISIYNETMGGVPAANGGATPNEYIASGQGFGVKPNSGGTVVFNNAMRVTDNNNTYRNNEIEKDRVWVNVFNDAYKLGSTTMIGYSEVTTDGFDDGVDSKRLATPVSIYSELETGEQLVIQGRKPFDIEDEVMLSFSTQIEEVQTYRISIHNLEGINVSDATVYLLDTKNGNLTNLSQEDYTFSSNVGTYHNRFKILYKGTVLNTSDNVLETISVFPNPTDGILNITSPNTPITTVEVFDIRGRKVLEKQLNNQNNGAVDVSKLESALYFISIYTADGFITKRFLKE
ncbi:M36 family metallopeptidase [Marixanthomonas ophiurae]|uniref:T9SS C-terminal target domain-containing protein n=1 Tax=Marixanthomonas ophiurae TaxID=387659 RepID=A0A3E1Q8V6_9FLAO|nr:M36 family metallopeptidase [Marixanthomonas ophiurae]RFN58565.1 T9SS C-terminal target domain-containing protein [Marixanthomonas ophiurae]